MKSRRFILDSTLRDGEQSPGISFTSKQKLAIAALLDEAGIFQIEAGIPSASSREKENITKIIENRKNAVISVWSRLMPSDIQHSIECKPDLIHVSIPVSYVHIYTKLRKNKDWVINQLYSCLGIIEKSGIPMSAGFEDAFRADPAFMVSIARVLMDFGVIRMRLSDTVGVASPSLCKTILNDFSIALEGKADLGFHAHNDLGMAVANTVESAKSGCRYADVTVGGIGERAGNCNLAHLVHASAEIFDWGITVAAAQKLENSITELIGK